MILNCIFLLLWPFSKYSESSEVGTIENRPTFGHQPVVLGGFYSAVKNQFIPGLSILPSKQIRDQTNVIHHPIQKTLWTHHLDLYKKMSILNIDIEGSVTVDLEAGKKLVAAGSFHYLEEDEDIDFETVAEVHYMSETRTESLDPYVIDLITPENPYCAIAKDEKKLGSYTPTHVVTSISYGGDAHVLFKKERIIDYDNYTVGGSVKATLNLEKIEIDASFSISYTDAERLSLNSTYITVYSDFILPRQPINASEALDIFQDISQNFGSKDNGFEFAAPKTVQLMPIQIYCKEATKVAKEVTRDLTEKAIIIRLHLKNDLRLVEYMLRSHAASDYYMGLLLKEFKHELYSYTLTYTKALINIIEGMRNGTKGALDITNHVLAHTNHLFNDNDRDGYINLRRRQVSVINLFYQETLGKQTPQVRVYTRGDIPRAILKEEFVIVLEVNVLPHQIEDNYTSYTANKKTRNQWFDDETVVGDMSDAWFKLKQFFDYNKYERGVNYFIKFGETNNGNPQDIKVYNFGKIQPQYRLVQLLTEQKYILDLQNNRNNISRNLDCVFGGDKISFFVNNPREESHGIIGVELVFQPYIPDQHQGKSQIFPQIVVKEKFENYEQLGGILVSIPVVPEYSYTITGSYFTKIGRLTSSPEVKIPGEFENMMSKVGCFVRNEYLPKKLDASKGEFDTTILCAESCYKDQSCVQGWSYQISTKKCYFNDELEIELLQPGSSIPENDRKIGWATGLKSCDRPDIDGGWSSWVEIIDKDRNCTKRVRQCSNPTPCVSGQVCFGGGIDSGTCPIDGEWGQWSAWSECSRNCKQTRGRECNNPPPSNEGIDCDDKRREEKSCLSCPVVLITAGGDLKSSEIYNPITKKSCSLPDLPDKSRHHSQDGNQKCGGHPETYKTCVQWNPLSGTWTKSHDLIYKRFDHVTWATPSGVYIMGGWHIDSQRTTEIITPFSEESKEGSFSLKYSTRAACSIPDPDTEEVIITGGVFTLTKATVYSEDGWQRELPQLNEERYLHACSSYQSNNQKVLMVTGGRNVYTYRDSTELFIDGAWRLITKKHPDPINKCVAINIDNKILLFGGVGLSTSSSDNILEFNQEKEEWNTIGSMKEARWGAGLAVVTLKDYAAWCN